MHHPGRRPRDHRGTGSSGAALPAKVQRAPPHAQESESRKGGFCPGTFAGSFAPLAPQCFTTSLQTVIRVNFCCLCHLVFADLLRQPQETNTTINPQQLLKEEKMFWMVGLNQDIHFCSS